MLLTLNISEKNIKKFSISIYYTVVVAKAKDHTTCEIHVQNSPRFWSYTARFLTICKEELRFLIAQLMKTTEQ